MIEDLLNILTVGVKLVSLKSSLNVPYKVPIVTAWDQLLPLTYNILIMSFTQTEAKRFAGVDTIKHFHWLKQTLDMHYFQMGLVDFV